MRCSNTQENRGDIGPSNPRQSLVAVCSRLDCIYRMDTTSSVGRFRREADACRTASL